MVRKITLGTALLTLGMSALLGAQTGKRLWVLEAPDKIVEYDPATFAPKQSLALPPEILRSPENLAINHQGQMLYVPSQPGAGAGAGQHARIWLWNGHAGAFLDRGVIHETTPAGPNFSEVEAVPQTVLSADGARLFWLVNRFERLEQKDSAESEAALDLSVRTTFRAWHTDLRGGTQTEVATFSFPPCPCGTAVCSETCPEASFWFPDEGVGGFFIVTHWIPGQIQSEYQSSFLYQRLDGKWSAKKLPYPLQQILDAAEDGETMIQANPDAGCCGWVNESDDQTLLTRNGKTTVLFDEWARYKNLDYDVSFHTPAAKLAPKLNLIALEIGSDMLPGGEIRLSSEGKPDAAELAGIRQALSDLPAVEVIRTDDPAKRVAQLPHANLVGWLNDKEILVIEDQAVIAFHVDTGSRRKSQIKAPKRSCVFLR